MTLLFELIQGLQQTQWELAESIRQIKESKKRKKTMTETMMKGSLTTRMVHHLSPCQMWQTYSNKKEKGLPKSLKCLQGSLLTYPMELIKEKKSQP
jgi:hypothetical protein